MAKGIMYSVQITGLPQGGTFPAPAQSDHNREWRTKLKDARANKAEARVICLCRGQHEDLTLRRLVVSYLREHDRFYLSAWQHTGGQHRHDCRFYSVWADEASAKTYASSVVTVNADGTFSITLPVGLSRQSGNNNSAPDVNPARHPRTGKTKPSMSLLGLGHFIWQQAEINTWKPQYVKNRPRNALWLASRINTTAQSIRVSRMTLSDVLLVSAANEGAQKQVNQQRVRFATENKKRMVVIALLKADAAEGYTEIQTGRLRLSSPLGFPNLCVSPNVFRACERSFGAELSAWTKGQKVVAILETEPPTLRFERINGRNVPITEAEVIGIALMRVTPRFIPVDSGYEAIIEARLCEQERCFIKPLRFDAEEDTLPDFVLTDVEGKESVPMEVFGMNTDEYRARRAVKTEGYNKEYGNEGWWSWDATLNNAEESIPPFPAQN
ncbi:DUF1173 family protein [Pantoea sp. GbtcB22]|uniref:DUF1173 family protein n=1 Tax=Pantoea sp. GbtcB22 TaxID=2824767 RepID=UPI001C30DEC1|nr:DUF1173 family protein [Pantoea sp. GbtcB22]